MRGRQTNNVLRLKNRTAVKIELIDMDSRLVDLCIILAQAQT